jgi:hypothetical protein
MPDQIVEILGDRGRARLPAQAEVARAKYLAGQLQHAKHRANHLRGEQLGRDAAYVENHVLVVQGEHEELAAQPRAGIFG